MANINVTVDGTAINGTSTVPSTKSKDTIIIRANQSTIDALAGNDVIGNYGTDNIIYGGAGNDSIRNHMTASHATLIGGDGKDTFYNYASNVTIDASDAGNDAVYIYDGSSDVSIKTGGSDKDSIHLANPKVTSVNVGAGTTSITFYTDTSVYITNVESGGAVSFDENGKTVKATLEGNSTGSYTLSGTSGNDIFKINKGDAVISNYDPNDVIILAGSPTDSFNSKTDVIIKTGSSSVRIKNGAAHNINVQGATSKVYGNSYTTGKSPQDVIKTFMDSLANTKSDNATNALNDAIKAATNDKYTTAKDLIKQIVSDAKSDPNFLEDYCGIVLDNTDTGAITGYDAMGTTVKTASSVVPESGNYTNIAGSVTSKNSGGLTVIYPTVGASGGGLNDSEKSIINGLHSWWIDSALNLNFDSYGDTFKFTTSSYANVMNVQFSSNAKASSLASAGIESVTESGTTKYSLSLDINMAYYNGVTINDSNKDGVASDPTAGMLDRTLAHEFTHTIMEANINPVIFANLPLFIKEGMAELTHGIDDERASTIKTLISKKSLNSALSLTTTTAKSSSNDNAYAAGYIFLRYLAKQFSQITSMVGDNDTVEGLTYNVDATAITIDDKYSGTLNAAGYKIVNTIDASKRKSAINITGNDFANSIKGSKGDDIIDGGASSNDTLTGGNGNDTFVFSGGNDVIADYQTGKDVIQLGSGVIFASADVDTVNKTVTINTKNGTDSGSITILKSVKTSKDKVTGNNITIADSSGNKYTRIYGASELTISENDDSIVSIEGINLISDITVFNASTRKTGAYITGSSTANSTFKGGKGADTIVAGTGNDSYYGGKGNDIFVYSGGIDTISDYTVSKSEVDFIKLDNATLSAQTAITRAMDNYQVSGNDVIIPFSDDDSLTIVKGKDKEITFVNNADDTISSLTFTYSDPSVKLLTNYEGTYSLSNDTLSQSAKNKIRTLDASKSTSKYPIYMISDNTSTDKILTLVGGKGGDTIEGSSVTGDVLTGGSGKDLFIYKGGNDTITDYTANQDTIQVADGIKITAAAIPEDASTDVVFSFDKGGTLTVKNAIKGGKTAQKLTITEQGITTTQVYAQNYMSIANTDGDTIDANTTLNKEVVEIVDASKRSNKYPVYLIGNDKNNSLKGGAGDDTLEIGAGDDNTMTGGKGNDLFVYKGGNVLITDFSNAKSNVDSITVGNLTPTDSVISGQDVIFGFGTNGSLTVQNAKDSYITFVNNGSKTDMSKSYSKTTSDTINGTKNDDTLNSPATGNNTIVTGSGNDVIIYNGGNDIITDYASGKDTIQIDNTNYSGYQVILDDVIFKFGSDETNTLVVKNAASTKKAISTIINGNAANNTYSVNADEALILDKTASDVFIASASDTSMLVTFDASSRSTSINITGNNNDNVIRGGKGADTLNGGAGNDTLAGGNGNDVFIYTGGNDVITDYTTGKETISVSGMTYSNNYAVDGSDVIWAFGTSSLRVVNGIDKEITFAGTGAPTSTTYGDPKIETIPKTDTNTTYKAGSKTTVLDASKRTANLVLEAADSTAITIKGGTKNDSIVGSSLGDSVMGNAGVDTIDAKAGNDTITTGAGKDVIIYSGGNDIITDYTQGQDVIMLASGVSVTAAAVKSLSDYVFTTNKGTIRVKNGVKISGTKFTPQKVTFQNYGSTVSSSQVYGQTSLTVANADGDTINLNDPLNTQVDVVNAKSRGAKYAIQIKGNANKNTLVGGSGADTIWSGGSKNSILGGSGNDSIISETNSSYNTLKADAGDDTIVATASSGNNYIEGGKGNDVVSLGGGSNTIVYTTGEGNDTIYSFQATTDVIKFGSSKTSLTSATIESGNYVLNVGKGKIVLAGVSATPSVFAYNSNSTINASVTAATSSKTYMEAEDTWFTSMDSGLSDVVEIDELLGFGNDNGIVSGDDNSAVVRIFENEVDNDLTSPNVESSGGLIKDKKRNSQ